MPPKHREPSEGRAVLIAACVPRRELIEVIFRKCFEAHIVCDWIMDDMIENFVDNMEQALVLRDIGMVKNGRSRKKTS